jgi:zinc protease
MKKLTKLFSGLGVFLALSSAASAMEVSFEQDSSLPVVYLNVAVKAGAVTDPKGQSGLTNFLGEMLLRGTKTRTKEQIDLALDQMGAKLEVEVRAEALIVRGAVLKAQLAPFLALMGEILTQPSFNQKEIKKLKSEIISELEEEMGHDPSLASRNFTQFLFRDHPYGKPILGTQKDIRALNLKRIQAHYEKIFRDSLLLVVGSGDATPEEVKAWADTLVGPQSSIGQNSASTKPSESTEVSSPNSAESSTEKSEIFRVLPPSNSPHRRLLIVDKDVTQTQINGGQIGIRMTDPRFFPLYLANHAFGGGSFSARLMKEIRVAKGWSYGASSNFRHGLQPRSWMFHLFPKLSDTVNALAYTIKMVEDLQKNGITADEFDFAKRSLVNSAGFMYDTSKKRVENKLLERTLELPDGFMKTYGPELEKVQLVDVNSDLSDYLQPDKMAISVLGPADKLKADLAKATGVAESAIVVWPYTHE